MQTRRMPVGLSHLSIYGGLQPDWSTEFSHIFVLVFEYDHIWSGMQMKMLIKALSSL